MKFVPSFFKDKNEFTKYFFTNLDNSLYNFNKYLFYEKNKKQNKQDKSKIRNLSFLYYLNLYNQKINNEEFCKDSIFLQTETKEFRNLMINNFLVELNNIKINKYSEDNIKNIKKILNDKSIVITSCDKNIGFAVMQKSLYNNLANKHLENSLTYECLESNPLNQTIQIINDKIEYLKINGHISNELNNQITKGLINCKLGKFKIMPKLHKEKFGIRPVISTIRHPTSILCLLIDLIIQPFVNKNETYLKDSTNLIQELDNINLDNVNIERIEIYSMDFESLYTNIKSNDAINKITEYLSRNFNNSHINNIGLFEILTLIFKNNIFEFNNKYYNQINGLIMGVICGPSIANLYLYILEIKWYNLNNPLVYKRFIDDIFYVNIGELDLEKFFEIFDYLKLNIVKEKIVNFLDLNISIDNHTKKFTTSLYIKPTNTFQYLTPSSNHPTHIYNNIPKSLFIRNLRICSKRSDFYFFSRKTINELMKRGYEYEPLKKSFDNVKKIDRNKIIKYKIKETANEKNSIRLIMQYDHNYLNLKNHALNSFELLKNNNNWLNDLKLNFSNSILYNLKALLIDKIKNKTSEHYHTKKCSNINCSTCKYIMEIAYLKINSKFSLPIMSNGNCESRNLIYIIKCVKCKYFYVGETQNAAKIRINQHLNNIKNFTPYVNVKSEVAEHFNLKGHILENDFRFCIFKKGLFSKSDRTSIEADIINIIKISNNKKDILINVNRPNSSYVKTLSFS